LTTTGWTDHHPGKSRDLETRLPVRILGIRLFRKLAMGLVAGALVWDAAWSAEGSAGKAIGQEPAIGAPEAAFEAFLDRLMLAESDGRDLAANPRSTALGPFQFIKATFIEVARRHFAAEVASLSDEQLLALRTNREFARRAAAAYSRENLAYLAEQGLKPTFGHLRLAFLVGPAAALRLMRAEPSAQVAEILSAPALAANPFMSGMSAAELIARAARDVGETGDRLVALRPGQRIPSASPDKGLAIVVRCNQKLASCRRWVALQTAAQQRRATQARGGPARRVQRPGV
jgi:hypothetical protein